MGEGPANPEQRLPQGSRALRPPHCGPAEWAASTRAPSKAVAGGSHTPWVCLSPEPRSWQPSLP